MKARVDSLLSARFGSMDLVGILIRGASIGLAIQVAGNGIGYIAQILLARWFGVNNYGIYSFLITWAQVFMIGALLGLDFAIIRFVPEYLVRSDWNRLRGIIRWSRGLVLSLGILLAGASTLLLSTARPIESSTVTMVLGSLLIPLLALAEIQTQIIRSTRSIGWAYAPPILLEPLFLLGLVFLFLWRLGGLADYISLAALLISLGGVIVLQALKIRRIFSGAVRDATPEYDAGGWLKVSFPLMLNSICSIIMLRVDTLAVGFFLGSGEVGVYSAAVKTATIVGITLGAVNMIAGPMISMYYTDRDMAGLQNMVSLATLGAFGVSLIMALGLVVFYRPLLGAFGPEFLRARFPMMILIAGQLVNVGSGSVGLLMVLTGHERESVKVLGCSALLISVASCLIIPKFGILGAAVVSALGYCLWNFWIYGLVVKNLGVHPSIFFAFRQLLVKKE
jgi:O-antigen/teichoic acid export membrane protein